MNSIGYRTSKGPALFDSNEVDPDKKRSAHIKNLVADRKKEEELRAKLVSHEIVKMVGNKPRASSA